MAENISVPISDMFDLIQKIELLEDKTVDKLLERTVSDLKGVGSIDNLKALNYFLLFRSNKMEISIYSYERVIYESIDLFKYILDDDTTNISALLCSVIEKSLPLISKTKINEILLKLVTFVETNLGKTEGKVVEQIDGDISLKQSLQILEIISCFIFANPADNVLFPDTLNTALISLIPMLSIELARKIFVSVLPKFIRTQDSNIILEQIWLQLINLGCNESVLSKQLFYLCLLDDYFITVTLYKTNFPLYNKPEFWEMIQKGLYHEDSIVRKQSLYLLKLYVDKFKKDCVIIELKIFFWNENYFRDHPNFWDKLFTFLELAEEKQTHLIIPAFNGSKDLFSISDKYLEVAYTWVFCVLIRLLEHPSLIVVKRGLVEFCNVDIDVLFNDVKLEKLLNCFFKALNNMFLFNMDKNSKSNFNHEDLLENWFKKVSEHESSEILFEFILKHLASISWGPVPLFYIASAVNKIPPRSLFNNQCLNHLKKILLVSLKNQNIYIRSAIQCRLLKCICNLTSSDIDIMAITNILGVFNSKESLKRGTCIWQKCVEWIESIPTSQVTPFFTICSNKIFLTSEPQKVETSIPMLSFGRMLVLITDSNKFSFEEDVKVFLDSLFEQFYECDKRFYSCSQVQDNCLQFFQTVLREFTFSPNLSQKKNRLMYLMEKRVIDLLNYIEVRLRKGPLESMQTAKLYEQTFYEIINNEYLAIRTSVKTLDLLKIAFQSITLTSFHGFLSLKIINHYCSYLMRKGENWRNIILEKDIQCILAKGLFGEDISYNMTTTVDPLVNTKGIFISEIKHTLWCIFNFYIETNSDLQVILEAFPISMLIDVAFNAISNDGKQSLVPILKCFVYLLPLHKNFEDIKKFIFITWNSCFELRKTELFWLALNEWIRMVYQDDIALNSYFHKVIREYAEKIMDLGEGMTGLVDIFFNHCEKLSFIPLYSSIFSKGLVFGVLLRKDKRMELDISHFIIKEIESGSMESFGSGIILKTDSEVRIKVLHLLLTLNNVENRNQLIVEVVQDLLSYDMELTKNNKKRYFNDSLIHRKKNKLLQALLILENYIYLNACSQLKDLPEIIYSWTLQSLISCSQQPSIRYQLEWLFMRLNIHYPLFQDSFWDNFTKAGNERLGSMCSFISIAYHLAVVLKEDNFVEQCIEYMLPWCMSQNFNIRLYAQVLLSKLWDLFPEIALKYHCFTKNQWKIYEQAGNMFVNAKKIENDFYFSIFHPIDHFTVQTIYWDLPRLSNISEEEWINPDVLKKYSDLCYQNVATDSDKSLASCELPVWIINNAEKSDDSIVGNNIQKKFVPSKDMFEEEKKDICNEKGSIILVASLIDKASNLGGLARTCEVFAAKELVVSNLDVIKDKEFISLSMTAEKHLRITEVKSYNLAEYLKIMKKMGYHLIGAEQTTDSVSLTNYSFPNKCVLLLGSEKEGIPPNLLLLLDEYIEIPQLGLLRSLNVHVTGAIFLWEYSKQHSLSDRDVNIHSTITE